MATFEQRESGYWQVKVRRKGWPSQSKSFRTKTEAEIWARSVESDMDKGGFVSSVEADRTTLEELSARFDHEYAKNHYRGRSWRSKIDHLLTRLGKYSLTSLTPSQITKYRDDRLRDPDPRYKDPASAPRISGSTVKSELDLLSKMLDVAQKEFGIPLVRGNVVNSIKKPAPNKARNRRLTGDEWGRLETACQASRNPWLHPALILAVESAMRQGELLGASWACLNKERRFIFLAQTKNGSERYVPMTPRAMELLESLPVDVGGRIIPQEKQTLYSAFRAALVRAGIDDFTWHDIRHEALSRMAESGRLDVLELSAISGHKTLVMTRLYVHHRIDALVSKLHS